MEMIWIVIAFAAGVTLGIVAMSIVQAKQREELEAYERRLKTYRKKLEQEFDFEFPEPPKEQGYYQ